MLIQVNYGDISKTDAIQNYVEEKVTHELEHVAGQITRVEVHLHDDKRGRNGDHDKRICVSPKVPPSVHWAAIRSCVRMRSIAVYWQAQTAHLYAAGGVGRKRDREAFEGEFVGYSS